MNTGYVIYSVMLHEMVEDHTGMPAMYAHKRSAVRALQRMPSYQHLHSRVLQCTRFDANEATNPQPGRVSYQVTR